MKITGFLQTTIDTSRELVVIRNVDERVSITVPFNDISSFIDDLIQVEKEIDDA